MMVTHALSIVVLFKVQIFRVFIPPNNVPPRTCVLLKFAILPLEAVMPFPLFVMTEIFAPTTAATLPLEVVLLSFSSAEMCAILQFAIPLLERAMNVQSVAMMVTHAQLMPSNVSTPPTNAPTLSIPLNVMMETCAPMMSATLTPLLVLTLANTPT